MILVSEEIWQGMFDALRGMVTVEYADARSRFI